MLCKLVHVHLECQPGLEPAMSEDNLNLILVVLN